MNLFSLDGKTAAVVGAASGIGEAVALGCARQGAHVFFLDVNIEGARQVAQRAVGDGRSCEAGTLDIRDGDAVERSFEAISEERGLDIVICTPAVNVRKPI